MNRALLLGLLLSVAAGAPGARAEGLKFLRRPGPSPDGKRVAFGYQGDIWVAPITGGIARRITVHPAYDSHPLWSPDGRNIAFDSNRTGNGDVFVVGADGGEVRRITYYSSGDALACWSPDGKALLFTSSRPARCFVRPLLFSVPLEGGMPFPVSLAEMREPALSGDGSCIAFARGAVRWWRRGYRGSSEMKIWLSRPGQKRFGPLVEEPGNHRWPMWGPGNRVLYYASDEGERTYNLWKYDLQTLEKKRLTAFRELGVRFPAISADGKVIVFASQADIFALDTDGGDPRPIEVGAPVDRRGRSLEHRVFSSGALELVLAPDGDELAFVVHGEVFALSRPSAKQGEGEGAPVETRANRLSATHAREKDVALSPDGTSAVFASDREGQYDLYVVRSADPDEKALSKTLKLECAPIVLGPEDETDPRFSPDGKRLAFRRGSGELVTTDAEGKNEKTVLRGWNLSGFAWSPDGRWFAFAREDDEYNSDVFVIPSDGSGKPVNLSQHPDDDFDPVWFPNGRGLAFVSRRNRDDHDVWMVFLRKKDFETDSADLWEVWKGDGKGKQKEEEEEEGEEEGGEEEDEGEEKPEKKKAPPEVVIDLEDIHLRLKQLTSLPGDETKPAISPDSLFVAFFAESGGKKGLWSVRWDGTGIDRVLDGESADGPMAWLGKEVFYLAPNGTVRAVNVKGGKRRTISFEAELEVDPLATRSQMFHEAWRLMDRNFYDADFHGADWKAARARYEPMALACADPQDFCDAVKMMLGELNASHLGIYPPGGAVAGDETGSLGVDFDPDYEGRGLRVKAVLRNGPAHREESRLRPGDVIVLARAAPVGRGRNLHGTLNHTRGKRVLLEVLEGGDPEKRREVVIRPSSTREESRRRYEAWIRTCRARVDEWSGGRFAYLHIRGMGWGSFERFERELYSVAHGKDGLVLDVRNNGGGWTADMLLTVLSVKPHAITRSRGGGFGYPHGRRPYYSWTKPAALLCNEASFSNAEIFSHAFKTLKRGPLVGRPTFGGVISTGGRRLMDGSWIRMPTRGWWVRPGGPDMELNGAVPDHDVPVRPEDEEAGLDPQLEKAVKALLGEMEGD